MIELIVLSLLVAFFVGLGLAVVLPYILRLLKVEVAVGAADIFEKWGWALGVAAGLWYFFSKGHIF